MAKSMALGPVRCCIASCMFYVYCRFVRQTPFLLGRCGSEQPAVINLSLQNLPFFTPTFASCNTLARCMYAVYRGARGTSRTCHVSFNLNLTYLIRHTVPMVRSKLQYACRLTLDDTHKRQTPSDTLGCDFWLQKF